MKKEITGMLPWGVILAALGGAIWLLLSREMTAGRWMLGGFLIAHGLVHVMFVVPSPAKTEGGVEWPFEMSRAWPVTALGLDVTAVRVVGVVLIALVVGGFALSGLSTAGVVIPPGWWAPLVAVGASASAAALLFFFNPQLVLGLGIDAVLLWIVITGAWRP